MWVAKIKFNGENALIGSRCKKFNVSVSGYPVTSHHEKDFIYVHAFYFAYGDEKNIKKFVKDLKKDERVLQIENNENFITSKIKEPYNHSKIYSHDIIHLKPLTIDARGIQTWTIGSWNKESLNDFIELAEKIHNAELLSIKNEKIENFFMISMQPHLTKKQKIAMDLAIMSGYYDYPRKIGLEKLAKMINLSYSTYHAHLRKAEQKVLPFMFRANADKSEFESL